MSSVKKLVARDPMDLSKRGVGIDCGYDQETGEVVPSMTKQAFRDECDINTIMRRYETTGTIDHVNRREPLYGDFSNVQSYQGAIEIVRRADADFASLSARVRERFNNSPEEYLAFMNDPQNFDEAVELGLVNRPEVAVDEPVVPPPPPPVPKAA